MNEVDRFYQNLLNKISNEGRDPFSCINCGKTHKDAMEVYLHNAKTGHVAKEAVDIPISLPVGPSSPDYESEKLPNSPEDNVFVPDDIDEDDQYITNINKIIFNQNDALEPISPPGQQKRYTEETASGDDPKIKTNCLNCGGSGKDLYGSQCQNCQGKGTVTEGIGDFDSNWACPRCGSKNINNIPTEYGMRRECNNCGLGKKGTEANDHMNEDEHNNTMNNDNTNEDLGEFPNTEPEAESTLDNDTAPLAEEKQYVGYDYENDGEKECDMCGTKLKDHVGISDHQWRNNSSKSEEANDPDMSTGLFSDTDVDNDSNNFGFTDANTTEEDTDVVSDTPLVEESIATEEIGGMCGLCNGEVGDMYNHVKNEHPEEFKNALKKANVSEAEGDKYELDSKTGDYVPADKDEDPDSPKFSSKNKKIYKNNTKDNFNSFGKPKDDGKEAIDWRNIGSKKIVDKGSHFETEDGELITWSSTDAERAQHVLQYKSKESLESFFNLGKKKVSTEDGVRLIPGGKSPKCDICGKSPSEHNNPQHPIEGREPSDHYYYEKDDGKESDPLDLDREVSKTCDICGAKFSNRALQQSHKKQEHGTEADQSLDTDNPQDLMDIDKTIGKDFDHKESYSAEAEYSHLCPKCHRTWHCMTQKNYGSCDEPYDSLCYDCKGENWVSPDEWTKSKEPVPQFIYDQVTRIGKDENATESRDTASIWNSASVQSRRHILNHSGMGGGPGIDFMDAGMNRYPKDDDYLVDSDYQKELESKMMSLANSNYNELPQHIRDQVADGIRSEGYESIAQETITIDDFKRILNNFQSEDLHFQDGISTVDAQTANAVVAVYDGISDKNKEKFNRMIQTTDGVIKIAGIMFGGGN